jgi:hypothetical protein
MAMLVGAIALAAAPINHAYMRETWAYATAGSARINLPHLINLVVADRAEYAFYGTAIGLLLWLWQTGRAPLQAPVSAAVLAGLGLLVLTQNAQDADIPLGMVICLLTYNTLALTHSTAVRPVARAALPSRLTTILIVILMWPALSVGAAAKVFAGYYVAATAHDVAAPPTSRLHGLAVPARDPELPDALSRVGYQLLSTTRVPPLRDPVDQAEYLETLLEAATVLSNRSQKVLVLDQVNPMPFMLGYPPPRGSGLWLGPDTPRRSAEDTFGDVDVVLVPKYSTYAPATVLLLGMYDEHLRHHFPVRTETPRWTVLHRRDAVATR